MLLDEKQQEIELSFVERIYQTFINVRKRLISLSVLFKENEKVYCNDSDSDEEMFMGPFPSDKEEIEKCLIDVDRILEHLASTKDLQEQFPSFPLCKDGWTIRRFVDVANFDPTKRRKTVLNWIKLQTLTACEDAQKNKYSLRRNSYSTRQTIEKELLFDHEHVNGINFLSISSVPTATITTTDEITLSPTNNVYDLNLLDLPNEILIHIFSYLTPCELVPQCALICRKFYTIILDHLWTKLELRNLISVYDVACLLQSVPLLKSLTFVEWNELSPITWCIWLHSMNAQIRSIRFQSTTLNPICVALLVELLPNFDTIIFDYQNKAFDKFDLLLTLLADKSSLKRITASYQLGISNFGILQLVTKLPILIELNLLYVEAINDETVRILCEKHKDHLQILKIDGAQLTDKSLIYIGKCKLLKALMIEFCSGMNGEYFSVIGDLSQLEELCLSKLTLIPLQAYESIFFDHFFPHMSVLKLGECQCINDACVELIVKACPNLKDLTLAWSPDITDIGFETICIGCKKLTKLSVLGCFRIVGTCLNDVPDKYLKYIKHLNFEQCNHTSDELLTDLYKRKNDLFIINYYGTCVETDEN
ncbi:unnamed protein product [Didymodactylos carnosus]|uniref:F-box domain-containing protein n=1 Tax=Didymodactylos carnosus TaxID=1234261 RepID=A0A813YEG7_9BILA|nr:unnamed protein product [Didymodactylos carnosus]CAF0883140.1 unnamed protein product [Didymodactylos carnosus]CAF3535585.1 unnamed protein product [Didymodactylos carnosus]CAF3668925.1 unnamed protein product [Didymodactylos carnosus]